MDLVEQLKCVLVLATILEKNTFPFLLSSVKLRGNVQKIGNMLHNMSLPLYCNVPVHPCYSPSRANVLVHKFTNSEGFNFAIFCLLVQLAMFHKYLSVAKCIASIHRWNIACCTNTFGANTWSKEAKVWAFLNRQDAAMFGAPVWVMKYWSSL